MKSLSSVLALKLIFIGLILIHSACSPSLNEQSEYGIRLFEIKTSAENFAKLRNGGKKKTPAPARLVVDDSLLSGWVSLSGFGTLKGIKRSYRFDIREGSSPLPFSTMKFSAQMQDSSFLRTLIGSRVLSYLKIAAPEVEPVTLLINGVNQGLYLLIERVDKDFYARRGYQTERIFESRHRTSHFGSRIAADPEYGFDVKGSAYSPLELKQLAIWSDQEPSRAGLKRIKELLDVDNALSVFAARTFLQDCDGFVNNLYLFRIRDDARIRFSAWDWERSYVAECSLNELLSVNQLLKRMLEYPSLRERFIGYLSRLVERFPKEEMEKLVEEIGGRIRPAYEADWYLGIQPNGFEDEADRLLEIHQNWMNEISNFMRDEAAGVRSS